MNLIDYLWIVGVSIGVAILFDALGVRDFFPGLFIGICTGGVVIYWRQIRKTD